MHQLLPGPVPVGSFLGKIWPIRSKSLLIALSLLTVELDSVELSHVPLT